MSAAPCEGATYLLFPQDDEGFEDLTVEAPDFCLTCPQSFDCLERGWTEKYGIWGGFNTVERRQAQKQNRTMEELWSTKFNSAIPSGTESTEVSATPAPSM